MILISNFELAKNGVFAMEISEETLSAIFNIALTSAYVALWAHNYREGVMIMDWLSEVVRESQCESFLNDLRGLVAYVQKDEQAGAVPCDLHKKIEDIGRQL